jgi:Polyketide cyclase / dehydrase and lipid transport
VLTTKTFTVVIPAPRQAVWAYISNPRQENPQGRVIDKTVEEQPGWFRVTLQVRLLGTTTRVTYETTDYNPPATITVITTNITTRVPRWLLASPERDTWTLTEAGNHETRIDRTVQLRHLLPGDTMLTRAQLKRQLQQVAKALGG